MNFSNLKNQKNATVLFDTDLCGDVDDVGALYLLLDASKRNGIKIGGIAVSVNSTNEYPAIKAILEEHGMMNIPVGIYDGDNPESGSYAPYVEFLAGQYNGDAQNTTAADIYRNVLSKAADHSVIVVSVGFFNNINRARKQDAKLFDRKVLAVVAMAGRFDDEKGFPEFNIREFAKDSKEFIENFGGEMIFGGFEIGYRTMTDLREVVHSGILLMKAYEIYTEGKMLRESWDPLTVDFAINGENEYYELSERGKVMVKEDRSTCFIPCESGNCRYILLKKSFEETGKHISVQIRNAIANSILK